MCICMCVRVRACARAYTFVCVQCVTCEKLLSLKYCTVEKIRNCIYHIVSSHFEQIFDLSDFHICIYQVVSSSVE